MTKMIKIPAGEFIMGEDLEHDPEAYSDEAPRRKVHLDDYWIMETPVTIREYLEYLKDTDQEDKVRFDKTKLDHPVTMVSWHEARDYCEWLTEKLHNQARKAVEGLQLTGEPVPELIALLASGEATFDLPTEEQWEKAARGPDGNKYPWGNEYKPGLCNDINYESKGTTPVGTFSPQGDSPYGVKDMAGNVWEWTLSEYKK